MTGQAVDVVVLTWNDGERLHAAVSSVLSSTGVNVRVQVVDNGSERPPVLPAAETISVVRNNRNLGVARARNQGTRLGSAPYVCFLDSDAQLDQGCLARLLDALEADTGIALSAPVFVDQDPEESAGRAPTLSRKLTRMLNLSRRYGATASYDQPWWEVDFAIGACQLFRRDAFEQVAGLDESYFYGPEDVDFCLRLRERGWRIVQVAAAQCDHPPRRRNRHLFTRRGFGHAWAVTRHLWRHRHFRGRVKA